MGIILFWIVLLIGTFLMAGNGAIGVCIFFFCIFLSFILHITENYVDRGKQIELLRNSISEYLKRIKVLKESINKLLEEKRQFSEIVDSFEAKLSLERSNNAKLNSRLVALQSCSSQLQSKQSELQAAITKLSSAQIENDRLGADNDKLNSRLTSLKKTLDSYIQEFQLAKSELFKIRADNDKLKSSNEFLRTTLNEAPLGFPTLLNALKLYDEKRDNELATWLEKKSHPAYTASQIVRVETRKRRDAEYKSRHAEMLLDYYFSVFPEMQEQNDVASEEVSDIEAVPVSEDEDMTTRYISREEYNNLSRTERNQLALDRFWKMNKSKRLIGRLYEQYIGYLYEKRGWIVEYFGISRGFEDLGRDLLCHKDITTLIIQCKNWSKSKKIYEKHIFQLFGTKYEYECNNPFEDVRGVFYTSTALSDLARSFARSFNIELHENFELQQFPIIKCNIGREGERIYHLPFDQQYYNTKLQFKDGDFYCMTVAEAEAKGFRRAYRWRGSN